MNFKYNNPLTPMPICFKTELIKIKFKAENI